MPFEILLLLAAAIAAAVYVAMTATRETARQSDAWRTLLAAQLGAERDRSAALLQLLVDDQADRRGLVAPQVRAIVTEPRQELPPALRAELAAIEDDEARLEYEAQMRDYLTTHPTAEPAAVVRAVFS